MKRALLVLFSLLLCSSIVSAASNGGWLNRVPAKERERGNPYLADAEASAAGELLYKRSCASCHGKDARGLGSRPSLTTSRVHSATDGELHWLLTNGSMAKGMPSWSRLPDPQRWQIVRYLHSLPLE